MNMQYKVKVHTLDDNKVPDVYVSGFSAIRNLIREQSQNMNVWMLQFVRTDGLYTKVYTPWHHTRK